MKEEKTPPIKVKFSKIVAEYITNAAELSAKLKMEYEKADHNRAQLIESVMLTASGLESFDKHEVQRIDLDNCIAIIDVKK